MKPTIYDVADRAGVSISTVSLALNNPDRVKRQTLARIMEAIDELGFVPATEAVARAREGLGRIGVVAPFRAFPDAFGRRLAGAIAQAEKAHKELVVFDQESAAESKLETLPLTQRVDGLVVMSLPFGEDIEARLREQGIATVTIEIPHAGFSGVLIDQAAGVTKAAKMLLDRGHTTFGYLGHAQAHDYESQSLAKLNALIDLLPNEPHVENVSYSFEDAVRGADKMLSVADPPSAILAHDDLLAGGVLRAARNRGIAVPSDLAVVGFNDLGLAEPLGLTTLRQPFEESGRLAVELLLDEIAGRSTGQTNITLGVELIERETT